MAYCQTDWNKCIQLKTLLSERVLNLKNHSCTEQQYKWLFYWKYPPFLYSNVDSRIQNIGWREACSMSYSLATAIGICKCWHHQMSINVIFTCYSKWNLQMLTSSDEYLCAFFYFIMTLVNYINTTQRYSPIKRLISHIYVNAGVWCFYKSNMKNKSLRI